ncbi:MAG: DUF2089 domain-containing protein [candidate division WOR-3 bacterium]
MKKNILTRCPVCNSELKIKRYYCPECKTEIEGDFYFSPILNLSSSDLEFLILFLKTRGNLSELAKVMGVSYPTVRTRFEEFLKNIGIESEKEEKNKISEILDSLYKGEISFEEAIERIKGK